MLDRQDVAAVDDFAFSGRAVHPVFAVQGVGAELAAVYFGREDRGWEDGADGSGWGRGCVLVAHEDGGIADGGVGYFGSVESLGARKALVISASVRPLMLFKGHRE